MTQAHRWTASSADGRWGLMGPYFAMFPVEFVRTALRRLARPGAPVLDPFCGRGTVPFVASRLGMPALGIDLNPVGWAFASTKTDPEPDQDRVSARLREVAGAVRHEDRLPENDFQDWAWCAEVLGFLRAARRELDWRADRVDRTLMAVLLVHLHGKLGNAASNQMRQSKAMGPDYAVRWWKARDMRPPALDPVAYFGAKVAWRYAKGLPRALAPARIVLGDSRDALPRHEGAPFATLLTSPPYAGVTNYRVDHWIRLWMLGEAPLPDWETSQRYKNRRDYRRMIEGVFTAARERTAEDVVVLVRTDSRPFTRDLTRDVLAGLWPSHRMLMRAEAPERSQTRLFGDLTPKPGETDFLLLPPDDRRRPKGFRSAA